MNSDQIMFKEAKIGEIIRNELQINQYTFLSNRQTLGIPLRKCLSTWMEANQDRGVTYLLDFNGIHEASTSVADEIGPNLFIEFLNLRKSAQSSSKELFLAYINLSDELAIAFERTFAGWPENGETNMLMVAVGFTTLNVNRYNKYYFFGNNKLPSALREILDLIYCQGKVASTDLGTNGIKAPSRKLNEINNRCPWLVRQKKIRLIETEKSWAYFYYPVLPRINQHEEGNLS